MNCEELINKLKSQVDSFSEDELKKIGDHFLKIYSNKNVPNNQIALDTLLEGLKQLFSQINPETVKEVKEKILRL